jgi:hypothetical protein
LKYLELCPKSNAKLKKLQIAGLSIVKFANTGQELVVLQNMIKPIHVFGIFNSREAQEIRLIFHSIKQISCIATFGFWLSRFSKFEELSSISVVSVTCKRI